MEGGFTTPVAAVGSEALARRFRGAGVKLQVNVARTAGTGGGGIGMYTVIDTSVSPEFGSS